MKDTRFGAFAANVLSVAARGLGWFFWYLLRMIYRRDLDAIAVFAVAGLVVATLIWLIVR